MSTTYGSEVVFRNPSQGMNFSSKITKKIVSIHFSELSICSVSIKIVGLRSLRKKWFNFPTFLQALDCFAARM